MKANRFGGPGKFMTSRTAKGKHGADFRARRNKNLLSKGYRYGK